MCSPHKIKMPSALSCRGQRVMLDRDLAELYGVETKNLNKAVKRNLERFEGDDFQWPSSVSISGSFLL